SSSTGTRCILDVSPRRATALHSNCRRRRWRRPPNTRRTRRSWCWARPGACSRWTSTRRGEEPLVARGSQSREWNDGGRRAGAVGNDDHVPPGGRPSPTRPTPSRQSLRGLDWFIFFLADVQTGFGPFIAVYLTTQKWTQGEIGLVLSIG